MYADDTIVFATSPEALQKLLDFVNTFCDKWNMTINQTNQSALHFQQKRNKKDSFTTADLLDLPVWPGDSRYATDSPVLSVHHQNLQVSCKLK